MATRNKWRIFTEGWTSKLTFDMKTAGRGRAKSGGITFPETFVVLNGCLPLLILAYDARHHQLGPDPVHNALHTTGTLAVLLLVATLAVTPLQSLSGWKGVVLYRRSLGLVAFLYAFLHVGIYVAHDQAGKIAVAWHEVLTRRYLQIGAVAFLLLVPLAMTSTPKMIQWLGYRRWKIIHRLGYFATTLAILHQYMQSKNNVTVPFIFAVATVLLFAYRVAVALRKKPSKPTIA
jgi:DMSO/TMAO reductase YedYZ heme-binding membrane subunit